MSPTLSVLDLATIAPGQTAGDAFANSVEMARAAERGGYRRVWYTEHHNTGSVASSATSVLIGYVAAHTSTIRMGAGGVMLPNHSPLVIAEQFGTLGTLFPGRIDLGLGRAPGGDSATMFALRGDNASAARFPQDVRELQGYLTGDSLVAGVDAVPRAKGGVPLYILGSSLFGARLAAQLGLPFAFASHFAPAELRQAIAVYRDKFEPSEQQAEPYVMASVNVFAAADHDTAHSHRTAAYRERARHFLQRPGRTPFTDDAIDIFLAAPASPLASKTQYTAVGTPDEICSYLTDFAAGIDADEIITVHDAPSIADRVHSVELTAEAVGQGVHR